jgi:uncharacterized membrane protein YeaQ/YmgE (transglycosylase-associated protein family)
MNTIWTIVVAAVVGTVAATVTSTVVSGVVGGAAGAYVNLSEEEREQVLNRHRT